MKPIIIVISRQFASMGRSIAQELSRQLGIEFYDRDIVEETAKRMDMHISQISNVEEGTNSIYLKRMYPLGMESKSVQNEIFMVQKNIIEDLAGRGSCIIVGRCADSILASYENLLSVYIYAPEKERLRNCTEVLGMEEKQGRKMMDAVDKAREAYRREYGGKAKTTFSDRHIMLDSSHFGVKGTAAILAEIAKNYQRIKQK
ncbi:MAG: AAA family ATPase [Oscillospiraceae bacterium]